MKVTNSFGRKTRRLPANVVPRGDGREEAATETGMGAGTGGRTSAGMNEGRDGGENRREIGDENIHEGGGEREPGNLRSGNRGGSEDSRRRATPTSNQQPQPQDPTPKRDRRIILRTRAQGREARARIGEGGGEP